MRCVDAYALKGQGCRSNAPYEPAGAVFARVRVECAVGRVLDFASFSKPRSAALTDASLGNAFDTAGSITTTFDSIAMRRAYFPRTMGPKSLRLYSGRSQLFASDLIFFIYLPFRARRHARWLRAHLSVRKRPLQTKRRVLNGNVTGTQFSFGRNRCQAAV